VCIVHVATERGKGGAFEMSVHLLLFLSRSDERDRVGCICVCVCGSSGSRSSSCRSALCAPKEFLRISTVGIRQSK
jgi:hypothetical protein